MGGTVFDLAYFQIIGLMKEELLAAVPLFIFMGFITEQAGLMERLFTAFRLLLAPVRGSLYLVVILTSTVFAMATGIVGAAVTVLGIMAAPIMVKAGYDAKLVGRHHHRRRHARHSDSAVGDADRDGPGARRLGRRPLRRRVRPGLPAGRHLHRLPDDARLPQSEARAAGADRGAHAYAAGHAASRSSIGTVPLIGADRGDARLDPGRPRHADRGRRHRRARRADPVPSPIGKFTLAGLQRALHATMATSSMVLLLAVTSNIFGAVFARLGTANWITQSLLSLQMPPMLMLVVILILIFLLGWPFEWPAIILVFLPIFYPVVAAMKIDLVWFGALVAVVLQTAFLSPPVAMSAYYLKQVVKDWCLTTIYAGMFQFMILQVICIGLLVAFPPDRDLVPGAAAGGGARADDPGRAPEDHWTGSATRRRSKTTMG